jgi:hypothetical protein
MKEEEAADARSLHLLGWLPFSYHNGFEIHT